MIDEDEAFIARFEQLADADTLRVLGPVFREHGHGLVAQPDSGAGHVLGIIERDKAERAAEERRKLAEVEVASGVFVNLADTAVPPTEEWLGKGDVAAFIPKQPKGTVRLIKTVRRVITPIVRRMYERGNLTDSQYHACMWYRGRFEAAGLTGRWKSQSFSMTGGTGGSGGMACAPMPQHVYEAEARNQFRAARAAMNPGFIRFVEAVVLNDIPVRRASGMCRVVRQKAEARLRMEVQRLADFCDQHGIETTSDREND